MADTNPVQIPTRCDSGSLLPAAQRLLAASGKVKRLIDSQIKAIEDKDLEALEAILRQKQPFIDQLLEFRNLKAAYELHTSSEAISNRDPLASVYSELENTIKSLAKADQIAADLLKERHAESARELQLLMCDRHAASYYNQPLKQQPKPRIDISS
jgi:flagellar biosynthesis/type III secretory pathway chaperone